MTTLLDAFEKLATALGALEGLEVERVENEPASDAEIAAIEKSLQVAVPDDVKTFWKRGAPSLVVQDEDFRVMAAARFVAAKGAASQIKVARDVLGGKYPPREPAMVRWLKSGIPLHEEESYCLVDASPAGKGAIYQIRFDGDPLDRPIAADFASFYEAWLASGAYSYGSAEPEVFARYWERVGPLVPIKIDPAKNVWLQHRGRYYEGSDV
jgi:hypothetical protein